MVRYNLYVLYERLFNAFGPQGWWPGKTPFEIAVGAILTQNTNWQNVEKAIANLRAAHSLSPRSIHEAPHHRLAELIKPSGYFNVKAKRLKSFVDFIVEDCGGSLMNLRSEDATAMREKLLSINGIGKETADSIMLYALNKPVFVIDTYTKRVLSRHGIISADADYDECQELFHREIARDTALYNEFHALFVRLGKYHCKPKPQCEGCPLKNT